MNKKILITGATGFIGRNLIEKLHDSNYEILALILEEKEKNIIPDVECILWSRFLDEKNEEVYSLNRKKIKHVDVVIHLASYGVDPKDNDINLMIDSNVNLTKNLLMSLKKINCKKIIFTGSGFEYGDKGKIKLNEDMYLDPFSIYGATKASSFLIGKKICETLNINFINLRLFNIFGEYEAKNRLLPQLIFNSLEEKKLNFTTGEQIRDYLYIKDVVKAYEIILKLNLFDNEIYNICSSEEISIRNFIEKAAKVLNISFSKLNFGAISTRKEEAMYIVGDNNKFVNKTGWKNKFTLEEGIENMYKILKRKSYEI
ncbi:NAD-dependent epimerase/dehydratase family protein [Fusobacterium varium]|uniref:NAD-dependent epimerase/dehydratase family protein n=1 Tax=Fusobacterium varium TaxID=856 RepID=UPI001F3CB7D7|nr:NAD(P)-dependent oxidoreductase [Fusobacterium varium]MCF2674258.1 NAD(P)-dependent oxidoreductase [Fusobacterium varium]